MILLWFCSSFWTILRLGKAERGGQGFDHRELPGPNSLQGHPLREIRSGQQPRGKRYLSATADLLLHPSMTHAKVSREQRSQDPFTGRASYLPGKWT